MNYNIIVVGGGYVGLSNAALLAISNNVVLHDISKEKLSLIDKNICPFKDKGLEEFFLKNPGRIKTTLEPDNDYKNADFVIIATPTNYDPDLNFFDTSSVHSTINNIRNINKKVTIVIRSTIPIGFTKNLDDSEIIFAPEFLREARAYEDALNPSRIIVSDSSIHSNLFAELLLKDTKKEHIPVSLMPSSEAESVKLFANSFLAMRVAFFNELDIFCDANELDTEDVIRGVSMDLRIGNHYNNPSFGYGGYCLPKDVKQLKANFRSTPQAILTAIDNSNLIRKRYIADSILALNPKIVGIFRLSMKSGADNNRSAAILDVIELLKSKVKIIIYEPSIEADNLNGIDLCNNLENFKTRSDLIVANRIESMIEDISNKIFTRDIFRDN